MNFLEQVVAEWFSLRGYFVQTNLKFGKRAAGGWVGEMDVVAFHPQTKELVHIETSMDALSWEKRRKRLTQKFGLAQQHYSGLFQFPYDRIRCVAIVGFGRTTTAKDVLGERIKIEFESIPEFFRKVADDLRERHPLKQAISENLPLLRAMQFALHWGQEKDRSGR